VRLTGRADGVTAARDLEADAVAAGEPKVALGLQDPGRVVAKARRQELVPHARRLDHVPIGVEHPRAGLRGGVLHGDCITRRHG
jgi:hypothetical protein